MIEVPIWRRPRAQLLALTALVWAIVLAILLYAWEVLLPFVLASLAAFIAYDWFFTQPLHTFTIAEPSEWVALFIFFGLDVFNNTGLVVHSFGDDGQFGSIRGLTLDENGTIYLLSNTVNQFQVFVADFRGEPQGVLKLEGLPALFIDNFRPDRIFYHKGHLYLVDTQQFKLPMTDLRGHYEDGFEFASIIGVNYKKRSDYDIRGFTIDGEGTIIFSIPVQSLVYLISPDKKLSTFGRRGSSPGKFNVVGGVAVDDKGYLYVADTLRCVIMVFNRNEDFKFVGEYGYRGFDPGNLIAPMEIAVTGDLLYVSQSANRGVSVYRISRD